MGPIAGTKQTPCGALSDIIIFCGAGHGWTADTGSSTWFVARPLTNGVVEDMGNIDQLNFFVQYCFNAGATVVPFRPVGYQTNEVVVDNDDAQAAFSGTWYDSSSTTFYGSPGDTPYRYAYVSTNSESSRARYTPSIPAAGEYPVYCWTRRGSDRVKQLYRIRHSGGTNEVRVNHRRVGLGWIWLGNYHFNSGTGGWVEVSNYALGPYSPTNNVVIADAIRFGNGMGDINRGFGVSGYPRELESARYWIQNATGQGMDTGLYDRPTLDDQDDNVGAPARMADNMNDETDGGYWDRIYLGFHSNAGGTRGPMGLYSTGNSALKQSQQHDFAEALSDEITNDMEWCDNGVMFNDDFSSIGTLVYGDVYGEISDNSNSNMNTTIIEVGYHDNADDAKLLKDPSARNLLARACYQALVKHLHANNSSNVPLALLPDPPTNIVARNAGRGLVTVSWSATQTNAAGGDAATGYVVYRSTNGYGFGNAAAVNGFTNTVLAVTNLAAGDTWFFRVAATNAGGESMPSETAGVRVSPSGKGYYLVVNGFDRCDRQLCPTPYFANNIDGYVTLVRPLQINSFDYVIQHGFSIAAAGRYFDSCSHSALLGGLPLTNYHAAYWILGEESTTNQTFSGAEQTNLTSFLSKGGCLFVSGAELAWDLDYAGTAADRAFLTNHLKSGFARDDAATNRATGKSGSIFSGMGTLAFDDGSGDTYNVEYPDVFYACGGGVTALVYGSSSGGPDAAAVQYSNIYRVVTLGFPFETVMQNSMRTALMARVVNFFGDPWNYDGDGDGMGDPWEILHFTNDTAATALGDADSDGANNWQEWVAGTDPTNAQSFLLIEAQNGAPISGYVVRWPSTSNRLYRLQWSSNLMSGFAVAASNIVPTPPINTYTDTAHSASSPIYYHIGVSEP